MLCVSEGCNNLSSSSTDATQQRLYSSSNHVSPGKSGSCFNKHPVSSASATSPPCGVLKNVMVSHHMDRSSSTPRLTLKFHHVKRHENGVAAASDVSRLHSGADSTIQLPATVSAGGKTSCSISHVDSQYLTSSSADPRYHRASVDSESRQVLKNSFEKTRNNMSVEQPSVVMPFSPQFEDISDAEDDVRPATVNSRDSVCSAPGYGLPLPTSHCLPPLSSALYLSVANSTFCASAAVTTSSSYLPIVGWNSYSGFPPQTAVSLRAPKDTVGQSSGRMLPWVDESRTQVGVVNHLSPVTSSAASNGAVQTADAQQVHLPPNQPFWNNRFVASDGVGCLNSEFLPVKSEVRQTDNARDHQTSFKLENYNGHVVGVKSESYIKPESPISRPATSRELCPTTFENKLNFFASQSKSEEITFSDRSTSAEGHHTHENNTDSVKTDSRDSEPNLHNSLRIKPDVDSSSPSSCHPCHHSPASSILPSLQNSCLEPGVSVNSSTPSAQVTSDVPQITNNLEPKVPPLRIIIPSKVCSSGSLSDGSSTNAASRCSVGSLPYVVSRTHSADSDVLNTTTDEVQRSDSSPAVFVFSDNDRLAAAKEASASSELVPAKRRKIKHSSKVSVYVYVIIICYASFVVLILLCFLSNHGTCCLLYFAIAYFVLTRKPSCR